MLDPALENAGASSREYRRWFATLVILVAVGQMLGLTMRMPSQLEANDISRWCTVWSLLERGTYRIDDCPWQNKTQDKVFKALPNAAPGDDAKHFYSSKPPLLPTIIAGILYPFRVATGVPLDAHVLQKRVERTYLKEDPIELGKYELVTETPPDARWSVYVFYFKPIIILLNIVPFAILLIRFARYLDRTTEHDWTWFIALSAAAFATPLTVFLTTLNNHIVAAWSAYFAAEALMKIWANSRTSDHPAGGATFAAAGFFGAFCACNELPAAAFGALLFFCCVASDPRRTLLYFVPAAVVPLTAFFITQYQATGGWIPVYSEFGTASYTGYEWSYWNTPLEMDWFDKHPEPKALYLFHMMLGHHGMFSLTPIFLCSLIAMFGVAFGKPGAIRSLARLTIGLSALVIGFYVYKTNNYGGSTQGLRWLFWIYPFWLMLLPPALDAARARRGLRLGVYALFALSVFSVGYGMRSPWTHPWVLDMLEHLDVYVLTR
ncbi:MAG: hypothetical protein SFX72_04225 [Isosphaeraceae bacterium]|nr:hypothetical protein [Isosphaeraceae bacterium]